MQTTNLTDRQVYDLPGYNYETLSSQTVLSTYFKYILTDMYMTDINED